MKRKKKETQPIRISQEAYKKIKRISKTNKRTLKDTIDIIVDRFMD